MTNTITDGDVFVSFVPPLPTHQVFDGAADLIDRDGLHCGDFYPLPDGVQRGPWRPGVPCCTIAALIVAQYPGLDEVPLCYVEDFENDKHVGRFARHLGLGGRHVDSIAGWSDGRSADEVVTALREAAEHRRSIGCDVGARA